MEKKGIELLKKAPPSKLKKAAATITKVVGIPLIIGIQIIFLALIGFYFKLNRDLTALSASVAEKEAALTQAEELETLLRATQNKLKVIATVKEALCYPCVLETLEEITPALISFTTASLEEEKFSFAAETFHGPSFALFVANLLGEEAVKEAAITSGSLGEEGRFSFTMELLFSKEKVNQ